jgi:hypothetical protein
LRGARRVSRSLGRRWTATVFPFADFDRSSSGHGLAPKGSDVAASATRVKDHLRRRLRQPDRRLRSLALPVGESGTAVRRS